MFDCTPTEVDGTSVSRLPGKTGGP